MSSCEFCLWISPFLQNTSGGLFLLLAFRKQPPEVFYEKGALTNFRKFREKQLWFARFQKHVFYRTPLGSCFWLFRTTLLKWGYCQQCLENLRWGIHYLETLTLEVPFRCIISFFGRINFQCVFICLHCLLREAAIRVEVFCKKRVLKDFINFIEKHLYWSLFLIKLQGWHLFWRTSSNDCFCTALAPLTVTMELSVLLSPSSSSSLLVLLISPMFVFGSN